MPLRAAPNLMRALPPVPRPLWEFETGNEVFNGVKVEVVKSVDTGVGVDALKFEDAEHDVGADEEVSMGFCEDEDVGVGVDVARIV